MRIDRVLWPVLGILALWLQTTTASAVIFTTNTAIGVKNTNFDGQDIVVIGCTLTVDGTHSFSDVLLLDGGILTHSPGVNGLLPNPIAVTNELHTFGVTGPIPNPILDNTNVVVSTIVVTDTNLITTYVAGTDYVIGSTGVSNQYGIARTPGSTIPKGATVFVSYTWLGTPIGAGLNLWVSNNLVVEAGSAIDVVGVGFGGGLGPGAGGAPSGFMVGGGGGGYGGFGGSSPGVAAGGNSYGQTAASGNLGSGGGTDFGPGAAGGGAVILMVGGVIWVDGQIVADGADGLNGGSGGGSGGSIFLLTSATFGGAGTISANGGAGEPFDGGGGGGGRIALYYKSTEFTGNFSAHGGTGAMAGGAGTIFYTLLTGRGQMLVDNAGLQGADTTGLNGDEEFDLTIIGGAVMVSGSTIINNLFVGSNSWLTIFPTNISGLSLTVNSNAMIQAGGGITLDGKGNPAGKGPGAGATRTTNNFQFGTGGGHGGFGGLTLGTVGGPIAPGGLVYGSYSAPTFADVGSGGGLAPGTPFNMGGSGGGFLGFDVKGTLTLNGVITANGNPGIGSTGGGGSGGGIALTVGTLTGTGNITANGGAGDLPYGGGGAGGRIAINSGTNTFTGGVSARGAQGAQIGGAGTIYTQTGTGATASLVIDNGGQSGLATPVPVSPLPAGSQPFFDLIISGGGVGVVSTSPLPGTLLTVHNLMIASNSSLTYTSAGATSPSSLNLSVTGDATIQPGASILGDGKGFLAGQGNGVGGSATNLTPNSVTGGGGGYGGIGGTGAGLAPGGNPYGSVTAPINPGSGGGGNQQILAQAGSGGAGGGSLEITVTGTLTLNGRISANGADSLGLGCGGGSGGSVWLMAGMFTGAGTVSANGGAGDLPNGGGGGGGRIAIDYGTNQFTGAISVSGGRGFGNGGAGTIYTKQNSMQIGAIVVDGGGSSGAGTSLQLQIPLSDLTVTGGAMVICSNSSPPAVHNLVIASNSSMVITGAPLFAESSITGDVTVQSGGSITADGQGAAANSGPGAGAFITSASFGGTGSGGSFVGNGGAGASGASTHGAYYGTALSLSLGSGGGTGGTTNSGAAGGGLMNINVSGTLTVNGTISANGMIPNYPAGGGGSGGGVFLSAGTLAGSGLISANGASGDLPYGGGGGGGTVQISFGTNQFTGSMIAQGGPGFANGGAGAVYFFQRNGPVRQVTIDNGGLVGTNTPLSGSGYNLTITGGAVVTPPVGVGAGTISNLLIDTGGILTQSSAGHGNVNLTIQGDALIGPGGGIVVDGDGFGGSGGGPGAGSMTNVNSGGSGGGYGGAGGASASGTPGGSIFGSMQQPTSLGRGGGLLPIVPNLSAGGGAIQLFVNGNLTVSGRISANGDNGILNYGGGSGGSIWLTVGTIAGNGLISANGGAGQPFAGGGGGGGRIAIYYGTNDFTGMTTASGGKGANNGQDGTIFTSPGVVFAISGTVTDSHNLPLAGIRVQSADGSASANTDANGNFSLLVPQGWSGTVGPFGGPCSPTQRTYDNVTQTMVNQGFLLNPLPITLSNPGTGTNLNLSWYAIDGPNYQVLSSSNLVDWLPYGSPVTGTNGVLNFPIPITDAPQMFFRLSTSN